MKEGHGTYAFQRFDDDGSEYQLLVSYEFVIYRPGGEIDVEIYHAKDPRTGDYVKLTEDDIEDYAAEIHDWIRRENAAAAVDAAEYLFGSR